MRAGLIHHLLNRTRARGSSAARLFAFGFVLRYVFFVRLSGTVQPRPTTTCSNGSQVFFPFFFPLPSFPRAADTWLKNKCARRNRVSFKHVARIAFRLEVYANPFRTSYALNSATTVSTERFCTFQRVSHILTIIFTITTLVFRSRSHR